jgi:hypothetical protein
VNKKIFTAHGGHAAHSEGQILVVRVSGSWNIEMHTAASLESQPLIRELESAGAWATVVVVRDTLVSSLEVLEAGRNSVRNNPDCANLVALAWVIHPGVEGYSILLPRYKRMYEGLLRTDVFSTLEQAMRWSQEVLRTMAVPDRN